MKIARHKVAEKPQVSIGERNYVRAAIDKYAKAQLISWESLQTVVMLLLIIFFVKEIQALGGLSVYIVVLLTIFIAVAAFGIYETGRALIMMLKPLSSGVFPKHLTDREKEEICDYIDRAVREKKSRDFMDMTATDRYALLEGMDNLSIIRWEDITKVTKKEIHARKEYKRLFFVYFYDINGKKRTLDIHSGKIYNPLKQLDQILLYIENNHPDIEIVIPEEDWKRMHERENHTASGSEIGSVR